MGIESRLKRLERAASERPVNAVASPALDWWQNAAIDAMGQDERQRLALAARAAAGKGIMSVEDCRAAVEDYQRRMTDTLPAVLETFPYVTRGELEAEQQRRAAML
jgi:hypothetical protein